MKRIHLLLAFSLLSCLTPFSANAFPLEQHINSGVLQPEQHINPENLKREKQLLTQLSQLDQSFLQALEKQVTGDDWSTIEDVHQMLKIDSPSTK